MIPGLAMFTARAEPLATWMTGLEVAFFKVGANFSITLDYLVVSTCFKGGSGTGTVLQHFAHAHVKNHNCEPAAPVCMGFRVVLTH